MREPDWTRPLGTAYDIALDYLASLPDRPVGARATLPDLRAKLDVGLPAEGVDPAEVIRHLAEAADAGVVATGSGRFFGFVIGGATPAALAADWLAGVWDQNAGLYATSPAAAVVEEVAARWIVELLGLPAESSVGFVTGAQMANATALAAARHRQLARHGWNVEADGLIGAPRVTVLAGAQRHSTIDRALRFLGFGTRCITEVEVDDQGRMRADAFRAALADASGGPVIVCAQAGNVDSGSFDPIDEICDAAAPAGAWVHVDGAFGLWAAASPRFRPLVKGVARADSWTTDAHKWLNVPYDSGIVVVRDREAHHAAMGVRASYLVHAESDERDALEHNPEFSRRARGFAVYAALRALGSSGVAALVERCCDHARAFAGKLDGRAGATVLNDVVLNQVLVDTAGTDAYAVAARIRDEGTCFMSATRWRGRPALRVSVSNWSTDDADVDRSVAAVIRAIQTTEVRP